MKINKKDFQSNRHRLLFNPSQNLSHSKDSQTYFHPQITVSLNLKTNRFPALRYYNPETVKQYVPKSRLQNIKLLKNASALNKSKKQMVGYEEFNNANITKLNSQVRKKWRNKKKVFLQQVNVTPRLQRREQFVRKIQKNNRERNLNEQNYNFNHRHNFFLSNNSDIVDSQKQIIWSPILITKKQFHKKINCIEFQQYEEQQNIFSEFAQNKLREIKQRLDAQHQQNLNKKYKKYSLELDRSANRDAFNERSQLDVHCTPWKDDINENQEFFSTILS